MSGWLINDVQRFSAACIKIRQMLAQESKIPVHEKKALEPIKGFVELNMFPFIFPMIRIKMFWKMLALKSDLGKR